MKKVKKINDDNYKDFKISIFIRPLKDDILKGVTIVKNINFISKLFGLQKIKIIDTNTYYYEISICIEGKGIDTIVLDVKDFDKNKYLIPFISYTQVKDLEFLNVEYLPNLNVEHIMKACKKELEKIEIIESENFIKDIILTIKKTIKEQNFDLKKKDVQKMDKLNTDINNLRVHIKSDIDNKSLPKSLSEYLDIYGSSKSIFNK